MKRKAVWWAVMALLAFGVWVIWSWHGRPVTISPSYYQAVLEDIMGVDFVFRSPTPNADSTRLAYIHGTEQGRGLFIKELNSLTRQEVPVTNEVTQISGWSPDGRYLAFIQESSDVAMGRQLAGNDYAKEAWTTYYDSADSSVRRSTDFSDVIESHCFWFSTNTYLIASRRLTNSFAELFLGTVGEPVTEKVSNYMPEIVVMSATRAGYAYKGNIYELELKPLQRSIKWGWDDSTRTVRQISQFAAGDFDVIRWLRYSSETGRFLFCARPKSSTWRYLFQYDPATTSLVQLNDEDTYNGQWLQGGTGFAYVGNTNNSFFLAVRPQDPTGNTNLFMQGSVVNYQVAPDGNHIFVTASLGIEPQGLWEYNVTNRSLRLVADGLRAPFTSAQLVQPIESRVESFDGLEIPCFFFEPVLKALELEKSKVKFYRRAKKYPVVIFLPPPTGQFQRSFDARSQLLANLGFYFVAVNFRGCDGYGRDYSSLGSVKDAAGDVLAVYEQLIKDPNVDKENIFLSSSSGGSVVAYELLAKHPKLWRGVALENPTVPAFEGRLDPALLPPILFATGDQDGAWNGLLRFQAWGQANGIEIESLVYTNSGHITYKAAERKDKLQNVSRFFLDQLR